MDSKSGTLLAPTIRNASCSHPRYNHTMLMAAVGPFDAVQALLILALSLGIIGANLLVIFVINHRRYTPYIQQQPRYLLTSLALNDFAIGVFITPFGVLPALFHCWPFGEIYCQIQALLRGALSQQSAVILVCMAIDRYICAMYPHKYDQHASKKGCVAILSITWTLCLTMFGMLVLPKGYYFNNTGLLVCEPFYSKASYRILATCSLYFPTTMILMYCYGSSFHANSLRLIATQSQMAGASAATGNCAGHHHHHHHHHQQQQQQQQLQLQQQQQQQHRQQQQQQQQLQQHSQQTQLPSATASPIFGARHGCPTLSATATTMTTTATATTMTTAAAAINASNEKLHTPYQPQGPERRFRGSASRTMAAMSLGFIVMATPWTIQEVVAACTGSKVPPFLDFFVTWTAISNSFWNPFLYWLLNAHFRRISRELLTRSSCCSRSNRHQPSATKSQCCSISSDYQNDSASASAAAATSLPLPPGPPSSRPPLTDLEGLSEKYWGEILERTVSSSSLHALQRIYGGQSPRLPAHNNHHHHHQYHQQHPSFQPHHQHFNHSTLPTILKKPKHESQSATSTSACPVDDCCNGQQTMTELLMATSSSNSSRHLNGHTKNTGAATDNGNDDDDEEEEEDDDDEDAVQQLATAQTEEEEEEEEETSDPDGGDQQKPAATASGLALCERHQQYQHPFRQQHDANCAKSKAAAIAYFGPQKATPVRLALSSGCPDV